MLNNNFIIGIITIIFAIFLWIIYNPSTKENFSTWQGHRCSTCADKNIGQCLLCDDCGVCFDGINNTCVRGDMYGPYDSDLSCNRWYYNDPLSRYINENNFGVSKPFI